MGAGHTNADFDAELGTQETGGTLVGHEAGNRSREPSPMKGMIYEVAVQQPVSPRRWAFTPQPSKEESCTQERHNGPKETREATETDTRRVMRRGKNRRWTGGVRGGHVLVKDGLCSPWPKQKNHSQKTTTGSFHKNTTQHSNCFGAAPSLDFPPTRTRLNLKLAAVQVSTRCSHLFTKSFILLNSHNNKALVLLQQPHCCSVNWKNEKIHKMRFLLPARLLHLDSLVSHKPMKLHARPFLSI